MKEFVISEVQAETAVFVVFVISWSHYENAG